MTTREELVRAVEVAEVTERLVFDTGSPQIAWFVECILCGTRGPSMKTYEEAVDAWNAFSEIVENHKGGKS